MGAEIIPKHESSHFRIQKGTYDKLIRRLTWLEWDNTEKNNLY